MEAGKDIKSSGGTKMSSEKKLVYISLGMNRDLKPGDVAPVYLDDDRDNHIGTAVIVETEDGGSECLITLNMDTPGARKVLGLMNKGDDISMSGHYGDDHE